MLSSIVSFLRRFFSTTHIWKGLWIMIVWAILTSLFQIFQTFILQHIIYDLESGDGEVFLFLIAGGFFSILIMWGLRFWFRPITEAILYETGGQV